MGTNSKHLESVYPPLSVHGDVEWISKNETIVDTTTPGPIDKSKMYRAYKWPWLRIGLSKYFGCRFWIDTPDVRLLKDALRPLPGDTDGKFAAVYRVIETDHTHSWSRVQVTRCPANERTGWWKRRQRQNKNAAIKFAKKKVDRRYLDSKTKLRKKYLPHVYLAKGNIVS